MPDNVELIESLWDDFGRGDLDKVARALADRGEVVFPANLPWGGSYEGPEAFAGVLAEIVGSFADFKVYPVRVLGPEGRVVEPGANLGFGAACNFGAREARGDLLLFLNPDAKPQPGFRDAVERPLAEGRDWAAWQGLVTADDGRVV